MEQFNVLSNFLQLYLCKTGSRDVTQTMTFLHWIYIPINTGWNDHKKLKTKRKYEIIKIKGQEKQIKQTVFLQLYEQKYYPEDLGI